MKIIKPVSTVFGGARSSKCQQPKIRFVSPRFGAMSAGLKDRLYGGVERGKQAAPSVTNTSTHPWLRRQGFKEETYMCNDEWQRRHETGCHHLLLAREACHWQGRTSSWLKWWKGYYEKEFKIILSTLELHLCTLIGTASDSDMHKIRIIGFLF